MSPMADPSSAVAVVEAEEDNIDTSEVSIQ